MIYFDNNASTAIDERVLDVMLPFLKNYHGNPSSLYRLGRLSRSSIATAREQIAALVSASSPCQVILTSGGTESNNLALNNLAYYSTNKKLAVSAIEHPSVLEPAQLLKQQLDVSLIKVTPQGIIDIEHLIRLAKQGVDSFSMMLANNETGAIQTIALLNQQLRQYNPNISIHTDAVQAIGKLSVNFQQLNCDFMSLSSHKIYGAKGCGALIVKSPQKLQALINGGGQEQGKRAGTENVAAIVGFGKAAELAMNELNQRQQKLKVLTDYLQQQLKKLPNLTIFAENSPRLTNTVQIGLPTVDGEMLLMHLDKHNIAISSGSACASGGGEPSHVLLAMGVSPVLAKSAIRISLGQHNTQPEIDTFIHYLTNYLCH